MNNNLVNVARLFLQHKATISELRQAVKDAEGGERMLEEEDMVYLQGDEAQDTIKHAVCEVCHRRAKTWVEEDRFGGIEVHVARDTHGDVYGFLCPRCYNKTRVK
jgi:hypothetical protein